MQVTDPVCGMAIDGAEAAASETVRGQTYYFCSGSCRDQFRADPDRYAKKGRSQESSGSQAR